MTDLFEQVLFTDKMGRAYDYLFVVLTFDPSLGRIIDSNFLTVEQTCTLHLHMNRIAMLL